jgi:predicted RNase H-like nuclease/ppGpp synthetase/RelA/SpoT-type nucleotidyltranferase
MHFVGLDLAWGENKPTGLAVLDDAGSLLRVSAHDTDASIVEALAPYVQDECLVGIDAPLVVPNATGNRPCEAALNRDFARFDAGAHPSNTGKPELAGEPRGAKVARLLGLDIDPASTARRRAVEVYPHPATVALFRLGRTLKYKNKPGRTVARMRAELLRLVELLEGLEQAEVPLRLRHHAAWRALVAAIGAAARKSELRRAEDQVDAVVCAYVAQFAVRRPQLTTTYGDLATGYIVTPTLPEGHRPSPRQPRDPEPDETPAPGEQESVPAVDTDPVRAAVRTYAETQPELRRATDRYVALVTRLLDDAGINYLSVTGRTKSVASFAAKADRTVDGVPLFRDPLEEITDQVGVRVITYLRSDVTAVADLLGDQLEVLDDRDMGQETARQGRFGYASRHLLVRVDADRGAATESLRGRRAQVQVRTVLQHAWAEFEHAIRYKGTIPEEHAPELDRRFTLAAGLLELADREFSMIRDQLQATVSDRPVDVDVSDPRIAAEDLATFLAGRYADAGWSRTDHYAWVSGLLLELGITSLDELAGLLTSVDSAAINARMDYRYPPGAVRRLDDALLAVFGPAYLELHGNSHRTDLLRARLDRLRGSAEDVES